MLLNYLLMTWRNLLANKLFSIINILGLAIGLAICMLISISVRYELSYENSFKQAEDTYRLARHYDAESMNLATTAAPFRDLLEHRFPEISSISLMAMSWEFSLSHEQKFIRIDDALLAESDIFDVLDLRLIAGKAEESLTRAGTVVLTEHLATQLFGHSDVVGKYIYQNEQHPIEITAVIEDLPQNTHLNFSMLLSLESMRKWVPEDFENWDLNYFYIYLKLPAGHQAQELEGKFPALLSELGENVSQDQRLSLQALPDIHLQSNYRFEMKANGSQTLVHSFILIALVIVFIACINYMNLSTAQATQRAKDVGVRKSLGASRSQLAMQYLLESLCVTLVAMLLACALVELLLPWFTRFVQRDLSVLPLYSIGTLLFILLTTLIVGLLAGSYPALYLSSFKPASTLKGELQLKGGAAGMRKILVIIQFSCSVVLVVATLVVLKQTDYARNLDPGYQKENNIAVSISSGGGFNSRHAFYQAFKSKLERSNLITSVAPTQQLPTTPLRDIWSYVTEEKNILAENMVNVPTLNVGFNFFEHYDIELVAGRYFSEQHADTYVQVPSNENPKGSGNAVVSISAAKALGFTPEQAVDQIIRMPFPPGVTHYRIIGVVEDIHYASLRDKKTPQIYHLVKNTEQYVNIRIDPKRRREALNYIESVWKEILPTRPISHSFLDENFAAMYTQEDKQAQLFALFSIVAISVATLGLFGLSAFTAERRRKEIGLRKVMGAKVWQIITLITADFSKMVFIANAVAWPIAYFLMQHWLSGFSQAISLSLDVFIFSGLISMSIAWLTVGAYACRAALARPVQNLRVD